MNAKAVRLALAYASGSFSRWKPLPVVGGALIKSNSLEEIPKFFFRLARKIIP